MALYFRERHSIRRWLAFIGSILFGVILLINFSFRNPATAQSQPNSVTIHRYESPRMDPVNLYWLETAQGIVLIDVGRFLSQARYALEEIRAKSNKPIIGILLTHPHTDHYGGLPVFVAAAGQGVPIYAAQITAEEIRTDRQGFIKLRKSLHGNDFPSHDQIPHPNRIVKNGDRIQFEGMTLEVIDLPRNEALTTTLYHLPAQRVLFSGDIVTNKSIPFLIDGNSQNWLTQLQQLQKRYSDATIYPGHGEPGIAKPLITELSGYINTLRQQVRNSLQADNSITPEEKRAIVTTMRKQYPDYETSMVVQNLLEQNIDAIAQEPKQTM